LERGDDPTTTSVVDSDGGRPHIIPRPNSGHPPTEAGDRGGWLQFAVLGAIVVGLTVIGLL